MDLPKPKDAPRKTYLRKKSGNVEKVKKKKRTGSDSKLKAGTQENGIQTCVEETRQGKRRGQTSRQRIVHISLSLREVTSPSSVKFT